MVDFVKANIAEVMFRNHLLLTLGLFILLLFFLGGSSRSDAHSMIILRPASVLMLGYAVWHVQKSHLQGEFWPVVIVGTLVSVAGLYLIPVPGEWWQNLNGRDAMALTDLAAFGAPQWRATAMSPLATEDHVFALLVPAAAAVCLVQLNRNQRRFLLPVCLFLGVASALLGLLQILGNPQGPLYLYRLTNPGSAVGIFANRNHQAIFLATLFPMLAAYATVNIQTHAQSRLRGWVAIAGGTILVPLLLVTGSRGGLIAGVVGIATAFWIYRKPIASASGKRPGVGKLDVRLFVAVAAILALAAVTLIMSRAEAIRRLFADDVGENSRTEFWNVVAKMARQNLPVGTGPGGFPDAYRIDEPLRLLDTSYLNHAHNDWLELFSDFGIFSVGILFLGIAILYRWWTRNQNDSSERTRIFGKVGFAGLAILAVGSVGDYPLRTPFLSAVALVFLIWCIGSSDIKTKN